MRAILVASAPNDTFEKLYQPGPYDLIVGVDGGCSKITKYPINIAFGDFDSLTVPVNAETIYRYKKEKDETDLELAIDKIIKMDNIDEIIIYNATGGRLDHFLCNLKLLERYVDYNITIIDEQNKISCLRVDAYVIKKTHYQYFSLIPCVNSNVTIKNALYEIINKDILSTDTYTVSNEFIDEEVFITINQGMVYLIESNDNK